jgi:hypothetical protein
MAQIKSCEGGGAEPPPMNEKAAQGPENPSAALPLKGMEACEASGGKDIRPPRALQGGGRG